MDEAERSRRSELQRRAFSRGGGLDDSEIAELRRLDALFAVRTAEEPESPEAPPPQEQPSPSHPQAPSPSREGARETAPPAEAVPSEPVAVSSLPAQRRRWGMLPALVLTIVVALLLGFGGGWLLLARADAPVMTADQVSAMARIEKRARFDPGSVVFLGEKHGAGVWRATTQGGAQICLALQAADQEEFQCITPPAADEPFGETLGVSLALGDEATQWWYWASLLTDISGREVVIVQRQDMTAGSAWQSQFTDAERALIDTLAAEGVDPESVQVVGYDGDMPVFFAQGAQSCLYLVAADTGRVSQGCDSAESGLWSLASGGTVYELRLSELGVPALTVRRGGGDRDG